MANQFSFGDTTNAFSFGAPAATDANAFSFGNFGATNTAAPAFNFGAAPTTTATTDFGAFNFTTPAAGTTNTAAAPAFDFGNAFAQPASTGFDFTTGTTGGLFGTQPAQTYSAASQTAIGADEENPDRRFEAIMAAYNPQNPACRFRFMFYNKVNPTEIHKYKAPANANPRLWAQAVQNNPDPKNLVPTQITGFDDLVKRMKQQNIASTEYQNKLNEIRNLLLEMGYRHDLIRKQEIERVRRVLTEQSHRLLRAMTKIESDRARDFPLLNTEVDFRRKLESIKRKLAKPNARVTELAVAVKQIDDRTGNDTALTTAAAGSAAAATAASTAAQLLDPENSDKLYSFLDTQRTALGYLMSTVKKDLKDVQTVTDGLQQK